MANTPYMNVSLPTVGGDADAWGTELNEGLETIDAHDHTPGKGTRVPTAGINIDADLDMNGHSPSSAGAVKFNSQSAGDIEDANTVQVIDGDLWFNNNSGTPVQITSGNSITSSSSPLVPSGVIWPYGGVSAPTGFLLCDGSSLLRASYPDLFAAIGTTYGAADGTHFNLPNMNGRVPVGAGAYTDTISGSVTRTLGASLGTEKNNEIITHTHTTPTHTHTISSSASITDPFADISTGGNDGDGAGTTVTSLQGPYTLENLVNATPGYTPGGGTGPANRVGLATRLMNNISSVFDGVTALVNSNSSPTTNAPVGSPVATYSIMQPSVVVNYIIKT